MIRIIDTVPDADDIDVSVSGKNNFGSTPYGTATQYMSIPVGSYAVKVAAQRHGLPLSYFAPFELNAQQDHRYTGIAIGNALSSPQAKVVLFDDGPLTPLLDQEKSTVRVVDALPSSTNIDVTINNVVAFSNVSYGAQSRSLQIPSGLSYVKTLAAGTYGDPIAGPYSVQLDTGKSYLLLVTEADVTGKPSIMVIPD